MEGRPYTHLRKDLRHGLVMPTWPPGVCCAGFDGVLHVKRAHELLVEAYRNGGGRIGPLDQWWSTIKADPEYDPAAFFLALDGMGQVIGLAHCWTSAFLKDIAVVQAWRRRGVGEALLRHAFVAFQARGAGHLDLKVENDNPSGAGRLYLRLGMEPVV